MSNCESKEHKPGWDEISQLPSEWKLYQDLISGIPEDIGIKDFCIGNHWVFMEAECGFGMSMLTSGGAGTYALGAQPLHMTLRDAACLTTSWNFMEASVGVAALNAWYSYGSRVEEAGMIIETKGSNDAFDLYKRICTGKKVTVVGHFPLVERLADNCQLTVLEREPQPGDTPDPACEYLLPHQDIDFITGITLTNKTITRLLQLGKSAGSSIIMVGPSVVPASVFYDYGVDCMAGSLISDPERARAAILHGATSGIFGHGVEKMRVERPGWIAS